MKARVSIRRVPAAVVLAAGLLTPAMAAEDVAAEIGGETITIKDLDEYLRRNNPQVFQQIYDARRSALDQMIADKLLAAEAVSRGVTVEKLREEVTGSAPAVTDADVEAFYNENKARMGGRTLDQIRDQVRTYLGGQKQQKAMSDLIAGLKEKKGTRVRLEPPRAEVRVAENDPAKGPKNAPVQIVEFSDFQ